MFVACKSSFIASTFLVLPVVVLLLLLHLNDFWQPNRICIMRGASALLFSECASKAVQEMRFHFDWFRHSSRSILIATKATTEGGEIKCILDPSNILYYYRWTFECMSLNYNLFITKHITASQIAPWSITRHLHRMFRISKSDFLTVLPKINDSDL